MTATTISHNSARTRYIPASRWAEHHPWPSHAAWRQIATGRCKDADLASCVIRRNGRLLINEQKFFELMESAAGDGEVAA